MHATLATPVSGTWMHVPAAEHESIVQGSPSSQRCGSAAVHAGSGPVLVVVVVVVGCVVEGASVLADVELTVEDDVVVVMVMVVAVVVLVVVGAGQSGIGSWRHSFATQASLVQRSKSLHAFGTPGLQRPPPSGPMQRSSPLHRSPSSQSSLEPHSPGGGAASVRDACPTITSPSREAARRPTRSIAVPVTGWGIRSADERGRTRTFKGWLGRCMPGWRYLLGSGALPQR